MTGLIFLGFFGENRLILDRLILVYDCTSSKNDNDTEPHKLTNLYFIFLFDTNTHKTKNEPNQTTNQNAINKKTQTYN